MNNISQGDNTQTSYLRTLGQYTQIIVIFNKFMRKFAKMAFQFQHIWDLVEFILGGRQQCFSSGLSKNM